MFPRSALILALVLAAGCSSQTSSASPSPSPSPTASPSPTPSPSPSPWTTITRAADGFSISIPPTWRAIDMDPQTMTAAFKAMLEQNPTIGQAYSFEQLQALTQQGIKVMAFDFATPSRGTFTNLNVVRQTLPFEMTADVYSQLAASQVEVQLKTATPKIEPATVGNVDGRVITYDFAIHSASGTLFNASFSQYVALRGNDAYVITFTTRSEDALGYRPTFDRIAASFALLP